MPEMIDVVHPATGDVGTMPVGALEYQRTLGWVPADEAARRPSPPPARPAEPITP